LAKSVTRFINSSATFRVLSEGEETISRSKAQEIFSDTLGVEIPEALMAYCISEASRMHAKSRGSRVNDAEISSRRFADAVASDGIIDTTLLSELLDPGRKRSISERFFCPVQLRQALEACSDQPLTVKPQPTVKQPDSEAQEPSYDQELTVKEPEHAGTYYQELKEARRQEENVELDANSLKEELQTRTVNQELTNQIEKRKEEMGVQDSKLELIEDPKLMEEREVVREELTPHLLQKLQFLTSFQENMKQDAHVMMQAMTGLRRDVEQAHLAASEAQRTIAQMQDDRRQLTAAHLEEQRTNMKSLEVIAQMQEDINQLKAQVKARSNSSRNNVAPPSNEESQQVLQTLAANAVQRECSDSAAFSPRYRRT